MLISIVITDNCGSSCWHESTATAHLNAVGKTRIWRTKNEPFSSVARKNVCHHLMDSDGSTYAFGQTVLYTILHSNEPTVIAHGSKSEPTATLSEKG